MAGASASAFISYAHADKEFARRVATALKARGHQVWIDHEELRVGDSLTERISAAIEEMDFVIAFVSPTSVTRPWAKRELAQAIATGLRDGGRVKVLPVKVGDVDLPPALTDIFYAELDPTDAASIDTVADQLSRDMLGHGGAGAPARPRESASTLPSASSPAPHAAAAESTTDYPWAVANGPRRITPNDLDGEAYRWTLRHQKTAAEHQLDVTIAGTALASSPVPEHARDRGRSIAVAAACEERPAAAVFVSSFGPNPWPPQAEAVDTATATSPASAGDQPLVPPLRLVRVDADGVAQPRNDGSRGSALYRVPVVLDRRPDADWAELFVAAWDHPPEWSTMHRPGIARVEGDRIILDGTTVEEVARVHKRTLQLAVEQANAQREQLEQARRAEEVRKQAEAGHFRRATRDAADNISFDDQV